MRRGECPAPVSKEARGKHNRTSEVGFLPGRWGSPYTQRPFYLVPPAGSALLWARHHPSGPAHVLDHVCAELLPYAVDEEVDRIALDLLVRVVKPPLQVRPWQDRA